MSDEHTQECAAVSELIETEQSTLRSVTSALSNLTVNLQVVRVG